MTNFEHMNQLIQNSEEAGTDFYGMTPEEILASRKLASGWKYNLNKDYENKRTSIQNIFTKEYVECPAWFANFYSEMFYTCNMSPSLTDVQIALFDFIKLALLLEDEDAYFNLVD